MRSLDQIDYLEELILDGTRIPFSAGRLVDEQEASVVLDDLRKTIPTDIKLAREIVNSKNEYLQSAKVKAKDIIKDAEKRRNNLISNNEIRKEAQRQISILQRETKLKCEKIITKSKEDSALIDKANNEAINRLEKEYIIRESKLKQDLENMKKEITKDINYKHNQLMNKIILEKEELKKEIGHLEKVKEKISIDISNQKNKFQIEMDNRINQTEKYCNKLIMKSRNESDLIKKSATDYVQKTLNTLNNQIKEMHISINKTQETINSGNKNQVIDKRIKYQA